MPVREKDFLRNRRRKKIRALWIIAFFPALIALLYLAQWYQDKRATIAEGRNGPAPNSPATASRSTNPAPTGNSPDQLQPNLPPLVLEALQLLQQKKVDDALAKVNDAIQAGPPGADAYVLRGSIYGEKKSWDLARKDYETALQFGGNTVRVKFNLADLDFIQKNYDRARPGFAVLRQDPYLGDFASYKTFLCDLWGGHEDVAEKELDAFNQVGSNASYYFANASWSLYHHKTEEDRAWLMSATKIYSPPKFRLYADSLIDLGYLPLPPPPKK